ncbi:transmembrane protein 62 isoform X1 [Microcaecilia unicolor]|nr:transmembrane protein 62 isoform X1 [Microcaecilia unicolor]XP_030070369.1 transmembrane protein 62 isoform X1 [Microcaecilia unicolor]
MDELVLLEKESQRSNQSVWFGHYPTSTIISPSPGIRVLMSSATAYLCGHLHTLGGVLPTMYSRHSQGTLELELGDWMDNRRYRILAFDHDLLSFTDVKFDEWPVVLITNPKSALYRSSAHEPLRRMKHSTHIRILAFSRFAITSVTVKLDGVFSGSAVHVSGPLYVLKWNPSSYSTGLHQIEAQVQDESGKINTRSQMFTLEDNVSLRFDLLSSIILLSDLYIVGQVFFILIVIAQVGVLVTFRYLRRPALKRNPGFVSLTSFSLHAMSNTNSVYYPLLLLSLYTAVGPWFVGEIIDGHVGVCFAFGVFVKGQFFQGSVTYFVGLLQLAFFNLPLMAYLCWCMLLRCQGHNFCSHVRSGRQFLSIPIHIFVFLLLIWQVYSCYFLLQAYGILSFFFSPMRTWLVLMTLLLTRRTWTLGSSELKTYILEMKTCQSS